MRAPIFWRYPRQLQLLSTMWRHNSIWRKIMISWCWSFFCFCFYLPTWWPAVSMWDLRSKSICVETGRYLVRGLCPVILLEALSFSLLVTPPSQLEVSVMSPDQMVVSKVSTLTGLELSRGCFGVGMPALCVPAGRWVRGDLASATSLLILGLPGRMLFSTHLSSSSSSGSQNI